MTHISYSNFLTMRVENFKWNGGAGPLYVQSVLASELFVFPFTSCQAPFERSTLAAES